MSPRQDPKTLKIHYCIDYGSANTADHHLLARRFAANVLPARLPMKRPRPRKSAPGGSKIEARGVKLESFRGWKDQAEAVFEAILEAILTLRPPPLGPPKSSKRALKWDLTSKPFLRRVLKPS